MSRLPTPYGLLLVLALTACATEEEMPQPSQADAGASQDALLCEPPRQIPSDEVNFCDESCSWIIKGFGGSNEAAYCTYACTSTIQCEESVGAGWTCEGKDPFSGVGLCMPSCAESACPEPLECNDRDVCE